ncbi:hypothetical protein M514_27991 [Trichuris suis]|uniref:Uncharacterized protein n=1 Tax=Trichuris suis TaxID=68888 RepID=A0A085MRI2_9BILA|nr:hypothetical protein M514_27991 [Trichuris suis]
MDCNTLARMNSLSKMSGSRSPTVPSCLHCSSQYCITLSPPYGSEVALPADFGTVSSPVLGCNGGFSEFEWSVSFPSPQGPEPVTRVDRNLLPGLCSWGLPEC